MNMVIVKPKNKKNQRSRRTDPALLLRKEYPGQPVLATSLQGLPVSILTTTSTGLVSIVVGLSPTNISNFAARFLTWQEYRIVKVQVEVNLFSTTQPGLLNTWFESAAAPGAPILSQTQNALAKRFSASDVTHKHRFDYVPHDTAEQSWQATNSGVNPVGYYKLYTDNANYGAPIVASQLGIIEVKYFIQFRGFV